MAEKRNNRTYAPRLRIPARLEPLLPKIHWALITLRQTIEFDWVKVSRGEQQISPYMDIFDDETRQRIERLRVVMRAPQQSRSAIVATALDLYSRQPKVGEPDRGLKAANVDFELRDPSHG